MTEAGQAWRHALQALCLFAVDPAGLGGLRVRAQAGPVRARFLQLLRAVFPAETPMRKMPTSIGDAALLGGLDLAATLQSGRPVMSAGLLAEAAGGVVIATMAERMPPGLAAKLGAALDQQGRISVVALDEGDADEGPCASLLERLGFWVALDGISHRDAQGELPSAHKIAAARVLLPRVYADNAMVEALCGAATALGVGSARAALQALRAARAAAAMAGRDKVTQQDIALAVNLVLAPRATQIAAETDPEDEAAEAAPEPDAAPPEPKPDSPRDDADQDMPPDGAERLLEAILASLPASLLAKLQQDFRGPATRSQGHAGARQKGGERGRAVGVRAGMPGSGARLSLIETLRAAAPWQALRARQSPQAADRLHLRRDDFRILRTEQRARSITIFLVDASGSAAFARLAEAKGAVELLLAESYQRRDQVAMLAFRGTGAQTLLPPTRSLVRAKKCLAALPGGGGTPLATGIEAGFLLAETVRRGGCTPSIVLLTDGRANVARNGAGGRVRAQSEAEMAARRVRAAGIAALVLDTSPRPGPEAQALAHAMGALYMPLPYANAKAVRAAVREALA